MSLALAQRLQKAIQKIQKQHPDAILQLNEGASEADFTALEAAVWLQLPDDIKEVYRVCNGQSEDSAFLFAGQEWLSLARIGEEFLALDRQRDTLVRAPEDRDTELFLQCVDGGRQARLRDEEPLCRLCDGT